MFFQKKNAIICLAVLSSLTLSLTAKPSNTSARVVDFTKCFTDSSYGKREQANFNQMKEQMEKAIQDLSEQMKESAAKLDDEFVRDALSPEAEAELQTKLQTLSGELQRYQQQYYYMLQQANMKTMQTMSEKVKEASHSIAQEKKYPLVMNQEQVFHYTSDLDITSEVISKLDEMYVTEEAALAKSKENATTSKAATK